MLTFGEEKDLMLIQIEALEMIAKMAEAKEGLTSEHMNNVGKYAFLIAKKLGIPEKECRELQYAAKIHDLGKMHVPEMILNKAGKLTDDEFRIIKSHTWMGLDIIQKVKYNPIVKKAEDIILYHHENYNGKGYPEGLTGECIPVSARIVRIADAFDALVSKRMYKESWHPDNALKYLEKQRGKLFDPHITDLFLEIVTGNGKLEKG